MSFSGDDAAQEQNHAGGGGKQKEGRKEEADLGVAEWRIPVWRIERRENRREMQACAAQA